uniref:Neuropeptide-1 n=1 Tax=Schmidtea mediterranea TaxID=79327 RepID=E3CTL1_SCHMD|nr:TPA_inf: neuropeptide precursor-1 [Schmidtea mediterranea]
MKLEIRIVVVTVLLSAVLADYYNSDDSDSKKRSFVRLGKRASFVRLGRSGYEWQSPFVKKASFVRLGKKSRLDYEPVDDYNKRASFVRLGRTYE